MIKAGIRANRYVRQNRDGAIQVMMEWGKTDREAAANTNPPGASSAKMAV